MTEKKKGKDRKTKKKSTFSVRFTRAEAKGTMKALEHEEERVLELQPSVEQDGAQTRRKAGMLASVENRINRRLRRWERRGKN